MAKAYAKNIALPYGFTLREYQKPLWNAVMHLGFDRGFVVWPRRNGKDLTFLNLILAKAMQRVGLYLYMGPFYTQIRNIIWEGADKEGRRFLDYIPKELIKSKKESRMQVELINGSILRLCGADNIDSVVGGNPIGIVFTEYSLHKPEAWDYLRPILAENYGWALFNGTPRGLNHFNKQFKLAERDQSWFTQYLTRDDTGIPSLEAIEADRRSGMPESLIQQEYYCSWSASAEEVIIPLDIVAGCVDTHLNDADYNFQPRILAADVAFAAKGDKAVIARRQGRMTWPFRKFQGLENPAFANQVQQEINDFKPHAVFIDSGRGEGVYHRLWQMDPANRRLVVPVHFAGKTYHELYLNKRTEMWFTGRDHFLAAAKPLIPYDEPFIEGLTTPVWDQQDQTGKIRVEAKKAMHTRMGKKVPQDEVDAWLLTHAEPVRNAAVLTQRMQNQGVTQEMLDNVVGLRDNNQNTYDPLNFMNKR
jgi:hypothetical protein